MSVLLGALLGACTTPGTGQLPFPGVAATAAAQEATGLPGGAVTPTPAVIFMPLVTSTPGAREVPSDLSGLVIRMEKTACEGACPVYSVEVHGDGTVIYDGKTCVSVVGEHTGQISQEQVRELAEAFYQNDFFSLQDAYVEDVQDIPAILIRFTLGNQTKQVVKQVYDPSQAPAALERLENAIDRIANTQQWVSADGTPASCP